MLHYQLIHLPIELCLAQLCPGAAALLHLLQGISQSNGRQKVVERHHLLGCVGRLPQSVPQRQQGPRAPEAALIELSQLLHRLLRHFGAVALWMHVPILYPIYDLGYARFGRMFPLGRTVPASGWTDRI